MQRDGLEEAVLKQNLAHAMQGILTSASAYSTTVTPEMEERQRLIVSGATLISQWLTPASGDTQNADLVLRVRGGGRQSNFGPVAWIRIYSPDHAPTAQSGFYIVYLFAADGSRAYLSLNQGTSEDRSGAQRPINKPERILDSVRRAREQLSEQVSGSVRLTGQHIDLAVNSVPVGRESKLRMHNYELGNIIGVEYRSGTLLSDDHLRADLLEMVQLLRTLYGEAPRSSSGWQRPGGESDAHKALKAYVANNPTLVGLNASATAEQEYYFNTPLGDRIGDHVDVIFWGGGKDSSVVEVELEGERNVLVGVHQAIKYRALAAAELNLPNVGPSTRIRAIVVAHEVDYPAVRAAADRYEVELVKIPLDQVPPLGSVD